MDTLRMDTEAIHKRIGHVAVPYKNFVVVWGGFVSGRNAGSSYHPAEHVYFYNCISGLWMFRNTSGSIPSRTSGSTGIILGDYLYIFGGLHEFADTTVIRYNNKLYRLSLKTLIWEQLIPTGPRPNLSDKGGGWKYKNKLYFFGGYGPRPDGNHDYTFQIDMYSPSRLGWTNNFFGYDPEKNEWFRPKTKGRTPEPRAAYAVDVKGSKAFIFGGRLGIRRSNELIYLNMDTMTWSANLNERSSCKGPLGRSWCTFTFATETRAVLYGGLLDGGTPAMDWWECEFDSKMEIVTWTKCVTNIEPRVFHQAAFSKDTGEIVIVGGVKKSPYDIEDDNHVNEIVTIACRPTTLYRLSLDAVVNTYDDPRDMLEYSVLPKVLLDHVVSRAIQNGQYVEEL